MRQRVSMTFHTRGRHWRVAGALAALAALVSAGDAAAATAPTFSCAASAVTAQVNGASVLNPVTAGRDGQPCQTAIAGLPNLSEAVSLESIILARTAYAAVDPGGAVPSASKPAASAGVEGLDVTLGGSPLSIGIARSNMAGSCENGAAKLEPSSEVGSITLAGTPIVLDGVVQPISDSLTDAVGAAVEVRLNEVVDLPDGGKAVRAAHVRLLRGDTSAAEVVVAESRLGLNGNACDPNAGGTPPDFPPPVCPPGSAYDVQHQVCVIPAPGSQSPTGPVGDTTGPGAVVVGPPNSGQVGGTVITLRRARTVYRWSPCVRGKGPKYVIVGSKRADRIKGTKHPDRIISLRGDDRVRSLRGRDCVDAGRGKDRVWSGRARDRVHGKRGRDRLSGGTKRDKLWGGRGRDAIHGNGGNDRLSGGRGVDTFIAARGNDHVFGGRGNDRINVARTGRWASVFAGRGPHDRVVCPRIVRSRVHGAEVVRISRRR
ncbi:MAG: hypothetical protein QOI80_2377 [Solirubrobacteraceae bacterium]|nr:hypothetical protein [Solirubrobacteraceae bacterium]